MAPERGRIAPVESRSRPRSRSAGIQAGESPRSDDEGFDHAVADNAIKIECQHLGSALRHCSLTPGASPRRIALM